MTTRIKTVLAAAGSLVAVALAVVLWSRGDDRAVIRLAPAPTTTGPSVVVDISTGEAVTAAPLRIRSFTYAGDEETAWGDAPVYRWESPTAAAVTKLATALGVDDEVQSEPDGSWRAGRLLVLANGRWTYYDYEDAFRGLTNPCPDPDVRCTPPPLPPAENLPSETEARTRAATILPAAKVTAARTDTWRVTVTIDEDLGVPGLTNTATVVFGSNGKIVNADGLLGTAVETGSYPTRSAKEALAVLEQRPIRRSVAPPREDCRTAGSDVDVCDPLERNLVRAERTYGPVVDGDAVTWYLPSYDYTDQLGDVWTAPALLERHLLVAG